VRKRRSKYGAIRVEYDGHKFDSKLEAARYKQLRLMEKAGEVKDLELQPKFPCEVNGKKICTYISDFRYKLRNGKEVVEDVKGVETAVFKLKKKLVEALYPDVKIEIVKNPRFFVVLD
tara:strand:- start:145 stop:498 length:354 start_codon:yes stop_codon:yes gene_type:complete